MAIDIIIFKMAVHLVSKIQVRQRFLSQTFNLGFCLYRVKGLDNRQCSLKKAACRQPCHFVSYKELLRVDTTNNLVRFFSNLNAEYTYNIKQVIDRTTCPGEKQPASHLIFANDYWYNWMSLEIQFWMWQFFDEYLSRAVRPCHKRL